MKIGTDKIKLEYLIPCGVLIVGLLCVLFVAWNNHKYNKINDNVTDSVEKYLEEYLGATLQTNISAGTLDKLDKEQTTGGVADAQALGLTKEDKDAIIESVVGTLTPSFMTQLNSNAEMVRQDTMQQLEKTIEQQVKEILASSDVLTDEQKDILVKQITVSVENEVLQVLKENYTELTNSITILETYVKNNLADIEKKLEDYKVQMSDMEKDISELQSKVDKLNVETSSDNSGLTNRLDKITENYNLLRNSFTQYINQMNQMLESLGLSGMDTSIIDMINTLSVTLQEADKELNAQMVAVTDDLQQQLDNNKAKIESLDKVSANLDKYIQAVEAGDETAREQLKTEIEASLTGLDETTQKSIQDVLNSASSDKSELQELIDTANNNLTTAKDALRNSITENTMKISELDTKIDTNTQQITDKITDNTSKISNLDQVSANLDKYIKAVESGDEAARTQLKTQIEDSISGLDEATKKSIQDVLDSASADKTELEGLVSSANNKIDTTKAELNNQITEMSKNLDAVKESLITGEFVTETDGSTTVVITIPTK